MRAPAASRGRSMSPTGGGFTVRMARMGGGGGAPTPTSSSPTPLRTILRPSAHTQQQSLHEAQTSPARMGVAAQQAASFYMQQMRDELPPAAHAPTPGLLSGNSAGGGHLPPLLHSPTAGGFRGGGGGVGTASHGMSSLASPPTHLTTPQRHRHAALIEDEVRMLDAKARQSMAQLSALLGGPDDNDEGAYSSSPKRRGFGARGPKKSYAPSPSKAGGSLPPLIRCGGGVAFSPLSPAVRPPPPPHPSMATPTALTANADAETLQRQRLMREAEKVTAMAARYAAIVDRNRRLQAEAEAEAANGRLNAYAAGGGGSTSSKVKKHSTPDGDNNSKTSEQHPPPSKAKAKRTIQTVIAEWQQLVDDAEAQRRRVTAEAPPMTEEEAELYAHHSFERLELRRINRDRARMGLKPLEAGGIADDAAVAAAATATAGGSTGGPPATISAAAAAHRKMARLRSRLQREVDLDAEDDRVFMTGSAEEKRQRLRDIERRIASQVLKEHLGGGADADGDREAGGDGEGGINGDDAGSAQSSPRGGPKSPTNKGGNHDDAKEHSHQKPGAAFAAKSKAYNNTFMEYMKRQDAKERGEKTSSPSSPSSPLTHRGEGSSNINASQSATTGNVGEESRNAMTKQPTTTTTTTTNTIIELGPTYAELVAAKAEQRRRALETVRLLTHRHWRLAKGQSIDVLPEPRLTAAAVTTLHGELVLRELEVRRGGESFGGGGLIGTARVLHNNSSNSNGNNSKGAEASSASPARAGGATARGNNGNINSSSPSPIPTSANNTSAVQTLWVRIEEGWVAAELAVPSVRSEVIGRLVREAGGWAAAGSASSPLGKRAGRGLLDGYGPAAGLLAPSSKSTSSASALSRNNNGNQNEAGAPPVTYELIRQLTPLAVQPIAGISVAALLQEVVDSRGDQIQRAIAHCPPESLARHAYGPSAAGAGANAAISSQPSSIEHEQRLKRREDELFRRQQLRDQSRGNAGAIRQAWEAMGGYSAALDEDLLADGLDDLQPPDLMPDDDEDADGGDVGTSALFGVGAGAGGGGGPEGIGSGGVSPALMSIGSHGRNTPQPQQFSSHGILFQSEMEDLTFAVDALNDIHVGGQ